MSYVCRNGGFAMRYAACGKGMEMCYYFRWLGSRGRVYEYLTTSVGNNEKANAALYMYLYDMILYRY